MNATLDGNGIVALEDWINRFGGGLIDDNPVSASIFSEYSPRWIGASAGYNVMVDIAIFLGEYLISKRPNLFWTINRVQLNEAGRLSGIHIGCPVLRGFLLTQEWSHNVLQDSRKRSKISLHRSQYYMNTLSYKMRETLHLATVPASDEPYIFGDYRDEPL